jgi:futalosine hydrolase
MRRTPALLLVPTRVEAEALLPGLVLEPGTPRAAEVGDREVVACLCGFGPVAAAALATEAFARSGARVALLLGAAGTYRPERLAPGGVLLGTEARAGDIGRGGGKGFRSAGEMGFPQVPAHGRRAAVGDVVALDATVRPGLAVVPGPVVTVSSASAGEAEAAERRRRHPDALAEDMESFAVALAAARAGARLTVLRGISNEAGAPCADWRMGPALAALRDVLEGALA